MDPGCTVVDYTVVRCEVSLPKIPSEPELERLQEIAIELMSLIGTGCDLNHQQRTSTIEIATCPYQKLRKRRKVEGF
jgi:hypothetical protein